MPIINHKFKEFFFFFPGLSPKCIIDAVIVLWQCAIRETSDLLYRQLQLWQNDLELRS